MIDLIKTITSHLIKFQVPKHANWLYTTGFSLIFIFMLQIASGISIAVHYKPSIRLAFLSIHRTERLFKYGWLVRNLHVCGSSVLFLLLYLHIFKGIYYKSYYGSKKILWLTGSIIYLIIILIGFFGSVLSWSQMSYWAAVVITNFVGSIPIIGKFLRLILLGGYTVGDSTLRRFFVFHCIFPFICLTFIIIHLLLVHIKGQTSPIANRLPISNSFEDMYPNFIAKNIIACTIMVFVMYVLCLIYPNIILNKLSYIPADYYSTPTDIEPEWYFLPYYSILKTFESKMLGITSITLLLFSLIFIPYIYNIELPNIKTRTYRLHTITAFISLILLGLIGKCRYTKLISKLSKACVLWYLGFFSLPLIIKITSFINKNYSKNWI
ncbi:cytochrome b [Candidatus Hodgkinia cicadicola]|uniref:Cytochrome b n=1 Tax=Candidatus Hodgkinia cicadicola TaxID=573658 RepID=A0ABX4MFK9_9HYPH|nr:cytochrome b [Candidatus Hodgkinia cicadicola]PIM95451.1 cytochrome b [Candidatus Hodgkinia cicadicola]